MLSVLTTLSVTELDQREIKKSDYSVKYCSVGWEPAIAHVWLGVLCCHACFCKGHTLPELPAVMHNMQHVMRSSEQSTPSVSFIRMWTEISSLRWTTLRSLPETLKMIPLGLSSWCSEMFNRCSQLFSSVSESIELWPIFSEKCDWNTIGGQFVSEAHASQENLPAALCQTCFGSCLFVCFFSEVSNKDREKSRFYCRLFFITLPMNKQCFFFS